jgi:hypothetical protein
MRQHWILLAATCMVSCVHVPDQAGFLPVSEVEAKATTPVVQLRFARIPGMESLAIHGCFVAYDPDTQSWTRWEVWQKQGIGPDSWGHLRRNLTGVTHGAGAGPNWIQAQWDGDDAQKIQAVLEDPQAYPWQDIYLYWPGPNSNTYIAWVLKNAGIETDLPLAGMGKDHIFWTPRPKTPPADP